MEDIPSDLSSGKDWLWDSRFALIPADQHVPGASSSVRDALKDARTCDCDTAKGTALKRFTFSLPDGRTLTFELSELSETVGYGHEVWRSSIALSMWMLTASHVDKSWFEGKRVLEFGAGMALNTFVLSRLDFPPREVEATDLSHALVEHFERNRARQPGERGKGQGAKVEDRRGGGGGMPCAISYRHLNWDDSLGQAEPELQQTYSLIVGSDLVYNPAHSVTLVAALERHLAPGGKFVLMNPPEKNRSGMGAFLQQLRRLGSVAVMPHKLLEERPLSWYQGKEVSWFDPFENGPRIGPYEDANRQAGGNQEESRCMMRDLDLIILTRRVLLLQ